MKKPSKVAKKAVKAVKNRQYNILSTGLGDTWSKKEANPKHNSGGFIITWTCKNIGFGELTFYVNPKGKLVCSTECMSKGFVDAVMKHFLDNTVKYES